MTVKIDNISLEEFTGQIERLFGKSLTPPAIQATADFWNHWAAFTQLISQRQLSAHVDPLFLAHNFPQYSRYHMWKGAGLVSLVLGLLVIWFVWPIGIVLLVSGIALHMFGNRVRFNDARTFAEEVMKEATLNATDAGFARLCAHYITGIIQLVTPAAFAHWPQHPSNVITGNRTFIETGEAQQGGPPYSSPAAGSESGDL